MINNKLSEQAIFIKKGAATLLFPSQRRYTLLAALPKGLFGGLWGNRVGGNGLGVTTGAVAGLAGTGLVAGLDMSTSPSKSSKRWRARWGDAGSRSAPDP